MKVTVSKYLNVRVGSPSVNAPCYQYLAPGTELEVDGNLYSGDPFDGNTNWYKDLAGNFYWSGGVDKEIDDVVEIDLNDPFTGYQGNGKNIGIAVFDSGVNPEHLHLKNRIKYYENFISNSDKERIHDHGHRVAGIIASDDPSVNRNISDLYCFRVISRANTVDLDALLNGLEELNRNNELHKKMDIVNLSLNVHPGILIDLQNLIDSLRDKGIVSVVAAGENFGHNDIAKLKNVIKVGSFDHDELPALISQGVPDIFDAFFLNQSISCYPLNGNNLTSSLGRDSAYTAFVSAILARHLSINDFTKDSQRLVKAKAFLNRLGIPINVNSEPFKIYQ